MSVSNPELWSPSRDNRLERARALSDEHLKAIRDALCKSCPVAPWPYGNATPVNPFLVVLGPSPGVSPAEGDSEYVTRGPQPLPTAGEPHPGVRYEDTSQHWDSMRLLAKTLIGKPDDVTDDDALSVFGHMNLDTGARREAKDVTASLPFASWILEILRDILRPRVLVLLGLKVFLDNRRNRPIRQLVERTFSGVRLARPHATHRIEALHGYGATFVFREWDIELPDGCDMKLVQWPQRIGRALIGSSLNRWREVCEEFKGRHGPLLR